MKVFWLGLLGFSWCFFLGYALSFCLLNFYEKRRCPIGEIAKEDREKNIRLMKRYSIFTGLLVACVWLQSYADKMMKM
jgi:hypothetical protein